MSSKGLYSIILAGALVWVGMGMVGPTHASTINWTLDTGGTNTGTAYGNVRTFTSSGNNLSAEAYSTATTTGTLTTAYLGQYNGAAFGLGVSNQVETGGTPGDAPAPQHTVDNVGSFDMVIFQFPAAGYDAISANLNEFNMGQSGSPSSDVTYWVGGTLASLPNLGSFAGKTMTQLETTYGFIRHDVAHSGSGNVFLPPPTGADGQTGRYLILAASYNDTNRNDGFKIQSLSGNTPPTQQAPVPEPSTILLLGSGLAGLAAWGRRKHRKD